MDGNPYKSVIILNVYQKNRKTRFIWHTPLHLFVHLAIIRCESHQVTALVGRLLSCGLVANVWIIYINSAAGALRGFDALLGDLSGRPACERGAYIPQRFMRSLLRGMNQRSGNW